MLAVFSLPYDGGALNLRRELSRLVEEIAKVHGRAIELRALQSGATRHQLERILLGQPGWDIVHLSGHGLAGGLLMETEAGERDLVSSTDLADLLDLGRRPDQAGHTIGLRVGCGHRPPVPGPAWAGTSGC